MQTNFTANTITLLLLIITVNANESFGQILSYTGAMDGSTSLATNATGTALSRINGAVAADDSACDFSFSTSNFSSTTTYSSSLAAVEVSVTPDLGYSLNVTDFTADLNRSGSGPASIQFAYSTDGGSTWTAQSSDQTNHPGPCGKGYTLSWSTSVSIDAPNTLKFRIYGFDANKTSGTERIFNLIINGTVSASGSSCGVASGLSTSNITSSSATLNWDAVLGATGYNIRYRKTGTTTWTNITSTTPLVVVLGLVSSTAYEFQVQTVCSGGTTSAFSSSATFTTLATGSSVPTPDHIVILILENHAYSQIIGSSAAPHINALANDPNSALFTQSFAIEHPSQPNYLDLYSGSNQGVTDDNVPLGTTITSCGGTGAFITDNLGKQLINTGLSWATYSEDLPCVGFEGATSNAYARKHNPAANWQGPGINQIPSTANQPFSAFPSDFTQLPTVCYVVPNQNNDMHNGTDPSRITIADNWMYNNLNDYIQWAKTHNSLFILTFDEDNGSQGNQIPTIFTGPMVAGGKYSEHIDHFDVLRTIEDMYGLPYAGKASSATTITDCWTSGVSSISSTNISSADAAAKVTVYPNPATSSINFRLSKLPSSPVLIRIFDIAGRVVGQYKLLGSQNLQVDLARLPAGNYYYNMTQNNRLMHSGAFIIGGKSVKTEK